ncbi:MAG: type II 3-dehydroquinate dehydratase [Solitalea-like symbiont of Acarus siro]
MKQLSIINGPNLNMLGKRETNIYGTQDFDTFLKYLTNKYKQVTNIDYFHSSYEGAIVDKIHSLNNYNGLIINAGALSHTSIAIADALKCIQIDVIEVHISNIYKREEFRHQSFLSASLSGVITGLGLRSYELALIYFINKDNLPENGSN